MIVLTWTAMQKMCHDDHDGQDKKKPKETFKIKVM